MRYGVGGRSAATAATANHAAVGLWNPSSTVRLYVVQIHCSKTVATVDNHQLRRISARGTAGSTVTPAAADSFDARVAPPSGALLDLAAYSAQPTLISGSMMRTHLPAAIGAGYMWVFEGNPLVVPPGEGIAIVTPVAVVLQPSDFSFIWEE